MRAPLAAIILASSLALAGPATAAPPTPLATEIAQDVTLQQAAQAGILKLSGKGGYKGDQVAVDLEGARIPGAPIVITTHIEFFGTQANGTPWPASKADEFKAAVESRLGTLTAPDGTKITVEVDARVRTGTTADGGTPGYHQIDLKDAPAGGLTNFTGVKPLGEARTGEFGANEPAGRWAHEVLHLAGLPDRYEALAPSYVVNGTSYPLPAYSGDGSQASKNAWVENVLFPAVDALEAQYGRGEIKAGVPAGHEDDIMADPTNPSATLLPEDLQRLVELAGVRAHGVPGDLLLDKNPDSQNFGVGASLDLFAPRGETAHVDGLYVFCIDFDKHIPDTDQLFDVLGPAADQPEPQLAALADVLEEIARRQDLTSPDPPLGAQTAVWALTEGDPFWLFGDAELGILAAAGVAYDQTFFADTPHFTDPNAAGPTTAAVSRSAVLPPVDVEGGPSPVPPDELEQPPRLSAVTLAPDLVVLGSASQLELTVLVEGGSDDLTVSVQRRKGRKWKTVGDALQRGANVGLSLFALPAPDRKGKYRVHVEGLNESADAPFKVQKPKRS